MTHRCIDPDSLLFPFLLLPNIHRDAALNAEDMASQSVRLKEEQLRKEEEKASILASCVSSQPVVY